MERDMDLIRQILLEIEKHPYTGEWIEIELEDYTAEAISYHILLLAEADLIEASDLRTLGRIKYLPTRLTWEGHEFLDAARDENRWKKLKGAMSKAGGFVLDVAKPILIALMKDQVTDLLT